MCVRVLEIASPQYLRVFTLCAMSDCVPTLRFVVYRCEDRVPQWHHNESVAFRRTELQLD